MTCNHYGQSSTVFRHRLHPRALLLSHSPLERTLASAYPPKPLLFEIFEVGSRRDLQSLQAKFHRIWAWFTPTSPTPEAQPSEANFSIRVSSQTPSFYTFRGRGLWYARADRETVEVSNYRAGTSKLSQYRSLEQRLKTVEHIEVSNYRGGTWKLSQYRSLEQSLKTVEHIEHIKRLSRYRTIKEGLENCRNIGHSSKA